MLWQWLASDYNEKRHGALESSPLECFLSQAQSINMPGDLSLFNEKFLVKVTRTVKHDATLSLNSILYETAPEFAGRKLDVRYDPDLAESGLNELFLYDGDRCLGLARKVRFADNANMKRRGGQISENKDKTCVVTPVTQEPVPLDQRSPISFFDLENL